MSEAKAPIFGAETPRDEARRLLARAFAAAGIASADLDARVLLCAALAIDHAGLVRDGVAPLGAGVGRLADFAARRLRREPVSRILGHREFWGARFALGPAALDPRADTETLVEAVLDHFASCSDRPWRILDLGVGSGAVLCAVLQGLPRAFGIGVDLSPAACAIAQENLAALGLASRGQIVCADWAAPLDGHFDCIFSNPPYIPTAEVDDLDPEVRVYDPRLALDGGADGLEAFRAIVPAAARMLEGGGYVAFEFGLGQGRDVADLLRAAHFSNVNFRLDLNGRDRIISAIGSTSA